VRDKFFFSSSVGVGGVAIVVDDVKEKKEKRLCAGERAELLWITRFEDRYKRVGWWKANVFINKRSAKWYNLCFLEEYSGAEVAMDAEELGSCLQQWWWVIDYECRAYSSKEFWPSRPFPESSEKVVKRLGEAAYQTRVRLVSDFLIWDFPVGDVVGRRVLTYEERSIALLQFPLRDVDVIEEGEKSTDPVPKMVARGSHGSDLPSVTELKSWNRLRGRIKLSYGLARFLARRRFRPWARPEDVVQDRLFRYWSPYRVSLAELTIEVGRHFQRYSEIVYEIKMSNTGGRCSWFELNWFSLVDGVDSLIKSVEINIVEVKRKKRKNQPLYRRKLVVTQRKLISFINDISVKDLRSKFVGLAMDIKNRLVGGPQWNVCNMGDEDESWIMNAGAILRVWVGYVFVLEVLNSVISNKCSAEEYRFFRISREECAFIGVFGKESLKRDVEQGGGFLWVEIEEILEGGVWLVDEEYRGCFFEFAIRVRHMRRLICVVFLPFFFKIEKLREVLLGLLEGYGYKGRRMYGWDIKIEISEFPKEEEVVSAEISEFPKEEEVVSAEISEFPKEEEVVSELTRWADQQELFLIDIVEEEIIFGRMGDWLIDYSFEDSRRMRFNKDEINIWVEQAWQMWSCWERRLKMVKIGRLVEKKKVEMLGNIKSGRVVTWGLRLWGQQRGVFFNPLHRVRKIRYGCLVEDKVAVREGVKLSWGLLSLRAEVRQWIYLFVSLDLIREICDEGGGYIFECISQDVENIKCLWVEWYYCQKIVEYRLEEVLGIMVCGEKVYTTYWWEKRGLLRPQVCNFDSQVSVLEKCVDSNWLKWSPMFSRFVKRRWWRYRRASLRYDRRLRGGVVNYVEYYKKVNGAVWYKKVRGGSLEVLTAIFVRRRKRGLRSKVISDH
jgi:hypothetical protein